MSATLQMVETVNSAARKLHNGFESGPDGPHVILSPAEAAVIWRLLTEQFGMEFPWARRS